MPAYVIRGDCAAVRAALMAFSSKIVAVQEVAGATRIDASEALTAAELATAKAIIAVRVRTVGLSRESGPNLIAEPTAAWDFRGSATEMGERAVVEAATWQEVARVVTTPGFFGTDPAAFDIYAVGDARATGTGAEVRITEEPVDPQDGDLAVLGTLALPSTGGAWASFALDGYPVRLCRSRYRLEARTGAALGVALCGYSLSLLEAR